VLWRRCVVRAYAACTGGEDVSSSVDRCRVRDHCARAEREHTLLAIEADGIAESDSFNNADAGSAVLKGDAIGDGRSRYSGPMVERGVGPVDKPSTQNDSIASVADRADAFDVRLTEHASEVDWSLPIPLIVPLNTLVFVAATPEMPTPRP